MSQPLPPTIADILIVDDDPNICFLLDELLSEQGYNVRMAHTLDDGAQLIHEAEPDVLLLDVQLPDGSGLDFCSRLQADHATADLPVLLLSGVARGTQFVTRGLDVGGYDVLTKPFYNDELLARVRVLVRLRKLQQRLIEQERERAMLATAGAAAHKLGQPLMAALGFTKLLEQSDLSAEQHQDVRMLHETLRQMSEIVRQIQEVQHYITQPYLHGGAGPEILDLDQARGPRPPEEG